MSPSPLWNPAGREREAWGYIVTFQNAAGQTITLHRAGKGALERCLDDALALDDTFRVLSISNPVSIVTDLNGRLPNAYSGVMDIPERQKLVQIRRAEMLHSSLRGHSDDARRRARGRGEVW